MPPLDRRATLGLVAGSLTALSGCIEQVDDLTGGGGDSGSTGLEPKYREWLGPEMADVEWAVRRDRGIGVLAGLACMRPSAITQEDDLPFGMDRLDRSELSFGAVPSALPKGETSLYIASRSAAWELAAGTFDPGTLRDELPAAATRHDTGYDHELYTVPVDLEDGTYTSVVAIGTASVVVVRRLQDPEMALDVAGLVLDTKAGASTRFTASNQPFDTLTAELEGGTYTALRLAGTPQPRGVRLHLDGDTVHRKSIQFYESTDAATQSRLNDNEYIRTLKSQSNGDGPRQRRDKFVPYTSLDVTRSGRYITVTGSLPKADLAYVDLQPP